ncbi:hypothetical protein [Glycomyces niveus]|uniref:Uncharacterized protein n=1 Tax=Glycomyces niveus TaxID=2820287 RepID=A0ABS3TZP4_9ACTN|nr:hypothetical protein [Glycomyces sp. NEAU-S30]MBO3731975.1 hypothetical protein [Glycomyces sp. NEAU-S30]
MHLRNRARRHRPARSTCSTWTPSKATTVRNSACREPEKLTLSEFSSASDLQWEAWGGASALATGRIFGNFCASDCAGDAYLVTLVLCEIEGDHYRKFGVFGDFPEFDDGEWAFGGPLYVGAQAVPDGEWSNSCAEPQPEDLTGQ